MFAYDQSDQCLTCFLKSSLLRVHGVCSRAVRSGFSVFLQDQSDQGLH